MRIAALSTIGLLLAAAPQPAPDGRSVRVSLRTAERAIDERIQQMTARAPFVLLGATRGAYLAGYGAVFSLEVNLVPVANVSPFRPSYAAQEIQNINRQKREKLGVLKAGLRQLLGEQAAVLGAVPAAERVAIVVTLFNYNWEDTTSLPSQLVLQGQKQALAEAQSRRAGPETLDRLIDVREF